MLLIDSITFTTHCSNGGAFVNEVFDLYTKFLDECAVSPSEFRPNYSWHSTKTELQQVTNSLTDTQKADIDSHAFSKFSPEELKNKKRNCKQLYYFYS